MGGDRGLHKMEGMRRAYNIRMQEKGWDEMRYHGGRCKIRMVTLSYCSQPHCEQVGPTWVHAVGGHKALYFDKMGGAKSAQSAIVRCRHFLGPKIKGGKAIKI